MSIRVDKVYKKLKSEASKPVKAKVSSSFSGKKNFVQKLKDNKKGVIIGAAIALILIIVGVIVMRRRKKNGNIQIPNVE